MGFISVLKKIGLVSAQVGKAIGGPEIGAAIATAELFFPKKAPQVEEVKLAVASFNDMITHTIADVEDLAAATSIPGDQKFAMVAARVAALSGDLFALAGKDIGDHALLDKGMQEISEGLKLILQGKVDVLNATKAKD